MSGLLTIKEIAHKLDIPESNIRYYRDKFEAYLPYEGEGRKRRYRPEAMDIFAYIAEQYAKNRSSEDIEKDLASRYVVNARPSASGTHAEVAPAREDAGTPEHVQALILQSRALQQMSEVIHEGRSEKKRLERMEEQGARMKRALYLLWREQKKLRSLPTGQNQEESRLSDLEDRVEDLARQQEEMRRKFDEQMEKLQECMNRCQFWTKRIMLQYAPEEADRFEKT
ncbi:MAG: MerR family transcriptional regulator [Desulfonatronovibrionaceae bacterium]